MNHEKSLKILANEIRLLVIDMLEEAKSGHPGSSLSEVEILTVLWFHVMRHGADRDRFVLSKGHGVPTLYAILSKKGEIQKSELKGLRKTGSRLQGHPDRVRIPLVEASTGSLGQGLSVAQGLALGLKMDGMPSNVYCLVGDGEIQEGQIWEAALSAPKFELSNLCVILDNNNGQIDGFVNEIMPIEPIQDKWRSFGWNVLEIDGHNIPQVLEVFEKHKNHKENGGKSPTFIVARTIKGKGVSFMENKIEWHGVAPKPEEASRARDEIQQERMRILTDR